MSSAKACEPVSMGPPRDSRAGDRARGGERGLLKLVGPHVNRNRRERISKGLQEGTGGRIRRIHKRLDPCRDQVPFDQVSRNVIARGREQLPSTSPSALVRDRRRQVRGLLLDLQRSSFHAPSKSLNRRHSAGTTK